MLVHIKSEEDKQILIEWFKKNRDIDVIEEGAFQLAYKVDDLVQIDYYYYCCPYKKQYEKEYKIYSLEDFIYKQMTLKEKIKMFLGGVKYEFTKRNNNKK